MKKNKYILILLCCYTAVVFMSCKQKEEVRIIALEDFFRNPERTDFQISPDAKHISFLAPYDNTLNLFIMSITGDSTIRITNETEADIKNYFWADSSSIIFLKDTLNTGNFYLSSVNITNLDTKILTKINNVTTKIISSKVINDEIIIALNKRSRNIYDAYHINLSTGDMRLSAFNPGNITNWLCDHDGNIRIAIAHNDKNLETDILYRESENSYFNTIINIPFNETFRPVMFTFDNKSLFATSNLNSDKIAFIKFDLEKLTDSLIYENEKYDIENITHSDKNKSIQTINYEGWKKERYFIDQKAKNIYAKITQKLYNRCFEIISRNADETIFLLKSISEKSLGAYYIYNTKKEKLTKIYELSPWIDETHMAAVFPISYKTPDGLTIEGYLTLPNGFNIDNAKLLPLIVNPHEGPWSRTAFRYNPETQFFANRGFAVFQMNYRGSTGYGKNFVRKSYKQWGMKMQDDIIAGVNYLIEQGIADKKRMAVYGTSYGGYTVLQALVKTPDLFACGINCFGFSNLFDLVNNYPSYWKPLKKILYEQIGDPRADSSLLAQNSPALHINKITKPIFITQGADDTRIKKKDTDKIVEILRKNGIEVEYMVKENEGHGFMKRENRFDFYHALDKFLSKHLETEKIYK